MEIILGEYGDPRSGGGSSSNRPMPDAAAPPSDAAQPEEGCEFCIPDHQFFECPKCGHCPARILSRYAHPEDAPEGPTKVTDEMIRAALATELEDGPISQDIGFGMMRMILENALNREVRDKKGDKTDD